MSKRLSLIALLGTLVIVAACGSGHDAAGTGGASGTGGVAGTGGEIGAAGAGVVPVTHPPCVSGGNTACLPGGFPFARVALAHSSASCAICPAVSPPGPWTILLSEPQTGTLCLSGSNPDPDGTGLLLGFTQLNSDLSMVLKRFNADLLGITQVRVTIDHPPSGGISLGADTVHSDVCHGVDCITFGFRVPTRITTSGTTTAALVDFVASPPQPFDTRALDGIWFSVDTGDFDFCVRDFQFLDANGAVVTPKP